MRHKRNKKGFVMLLVVSLIPLLGITSLVLTANSKQLLTQSRRLAVKTHAQLACESGIAWLEKNTAKSVTKDRPVVLEIDHEDKIITCTIELVSQTDKEAVLNVTGYAEGKRFSYEHSQQFVFIADNIQEQT